MKTDSDLNAATKEYERLFGEPPDLLWYDGDGDKWLALIKKAVSDKKPLPDFYAANGLPDDALV